MKMSFIIIGWILIQVTKEEQEGNTFASQRRGNSGKAKLNPADEDILEEQENKFSIKMSSIKKKKEFNGNEMENLRTIKKPLKLDKFFVAQSGIKTVNNLSFKDNNVKFKQSNKHPKTKTPEDLYFLDKDLHGSPFSYKPKENINSDIGLNNKFILKKLQESANNLKEFVGKKPQRSNVPKRHFSKRKNLMKEGLLASNYFTSLTTEDYSADIPIGVNNIELTTSNKIQTDVNNLGVKRYKKPVHKEISAGMKHSKIIGKTKDKVKKSKTTTYVKTDSSSVAKNKVATTSSYSSSTRVKSTRSKPFSKILSRNSFENISSDFNSLTKIPDILNSMVDKIGDKGSFNLRKLLNPQSTTYFQLDRGLFANRLDYVKEQLEALVTSKMSLYDKNLAVSNSMDKNSMSPDDRCTCPHTESLSADMKSSRNTERLEPGEVTKGRGPPKIATKSDRIWTTCIGVYNDYSESSPPVTAELHKFNSSRTRENSKIPETSTLEMLTTNRTTVTSRTASSSSQTEVSEKEDHNSTFNIRDKHLLADMSLRTVCFEIKALDISLKPSSQNNTTPLPKTSTISSTTMWTQATKDVTKDVTYDRTTTADGYASNKTTTKTRSSEPSFKDKADYLSRDTPSKALRTTCFGITETTDVTNTTTEVTNATTEVKVIKTESTTCTTVTQVTTLTTETQSTTQPTTVPTITSTEVSVNPPRPAKTASTYLTQNQSIGTTCFTLSSSQSSTLETSTCPTSSTSSVSRRADSKAARTRKCTTEPFTDESCIPIRTTASRPRTSKYTEEISTESIRTTRKPRTTKGTTEYSTTETCRTGKPSRRRTTTCVEDYIEETSRTTGTTRKQRTSSKMTEPTTTNSRKTTRRLRSTKCTNKTSAETRASPRRTTTNCYEEQATSEEDYETFTRTTKGSKKRKRSTFHRPPDKTIRIVFTVEWPEWRYSSTQVNQAKQFEKSKEKKSKEDNDYEYEYDYEDDDITTTEDDIYFESDSPSNANIHTESRMEENYIDFEPEQYLIKEKNRKLNETLQSLSGQSLNEKPQINMTFIVHKQKHKIPKSMTTKIRKTLFKTTKRKKHLPVYEPFPYLKKLKQDATAFASDSASKIKFFKPASAKLTNMIDPEYYDNVPFLRRNSYQHFANAKIRESQEPSLKFNEENEREKSLFNEAINMLGNATEIYSGFGRAHGLLTRKANEDVIFGLKANPHKIEATENVALELATSVQVDNKKKTKFTETTLVTEATGCNELDNQDYIEIETPSSESSQKNTSDNETSLHQTRRFPYIPGLRKGHSRSKSASSTTELSELINMKSAEEIKQLCLPVYILPDSLKCLQSSSIKCLVLDTPGLSDTTAPITITPITSTPQGSTISELPIRETSNKNEVSACTTTDFNLNVTAEVPSVEAEKTTTSISGSTTNAEQSSETSERHSNCTEVKSTTHSMESSTYSTVPDTPKDVSDKRLTQNAFNMAVHGTVCTTTCLPPVADSSNVDSDNVIFQKEQDGKLLIFTVCMGKVTAQCMSCTPTSIKKKNTSKKSSTTKKYKKKIKHEKATSVEEDIDKDQSDKLKLKIDLFKNIKFPIIPIDSAEEDEPIVGKNNILIQNVAKHIREPVKPFLLLPYSDPRQIGLYMPPASPYIRNPLYPVHIKNLYPYAASDNAKTFHKKQREDFSRGKIVVNGIGLPDGLYSLDDLKDLNKTNLLASLLESGRIFSGETEDHNHELRRVQKHSNQERGIHSKSEEKPHYSTCQRNSIQTNLHKGRFQPTRNKDQFKELNNDPKINHNLKPPWFKNILHRNHLSPSDISNDAEVIDTLSGNFYPGISPRSNKTIINKSRKYWKNIWSPMVHRTYKNSEYDNR